MSDLLVDVVAKRPRDPEQLRLLAERLQVPLSREWLRTLRWAGRNVLVCGTDKATGWSSGSARRSAMQHETSQRELDRRRGAVPDHVAADGARLGPDPTERKRAS